MRKVLKLTSGLLIVALIFSAGVVVGRGDFRVSGLSYQPATGGSTFDYSSVDQLYDLLKANFDGSLDKTKLLDGVKSGLVEAAGDPYTEYFNPEEAKEFNSELTGTFTGIGAELGADSEGRILIVAPLAGYPAEKAGLLPKDLVAAVNGQTTSDMSVSQVVRKIRGPAGTEVKLTIVRSQTAPFEVTITRTEIKVPSVKYEVTEDIGYLKISQFTADTIDLTNNALRDFKDKNVKGIILDLRGDPGGYLDSAVAVASLWLDSGKVVVTERRGSSVLSTKYSKGAHPLKGLPTVVLINGGSASASEIVAGALRDHKAATLVGEKTFGKGSIQKVEELPRGAELKVTVARWYTPSGKNIDKQGINPDVEVATSAQDQSAGQDPQKDKAIEILRGKI